MLDIHLSLGTKMDSITKGELVQFVDMITAKGWVNVNTGNGFKAAINKILADVPEKEDARKIDVRNQVLRYNNAHPGELSPASLKQYEKRINSAIAYFAEYKDDPTNFKVRQRAIPNGGKAEPEKRKATKTPPASGIEVVTPATGSLSMASLPPTAVTASLALPFPLRPDYLAQIVIPRNLTMEEAERLCSFIRSLAQQVSK